MYFYPTWPSHTSLEFHMVHLSSRSFIHDTERAVSLCDMSQQTGAGQWTVTHVAGAGLFCCGTYESWFGGRARGLSTSYWWLNSGPGHALHLCLHDDAWQRPSCASTSAPDLDRKTTVPCVAKVIFGCVACIWWPFSWFICYCQTWA